MLLNLGFFFGVDRVVAEKVGYVGLVAVSNRILRN